MAALSTKKVEIKKMVIDDVPLLWQDSIPSLFSTVWNHLTLIFV